MPAFGLDFLLVPVGGAPLVEGWPLGQFASNKVWGLVCDYNSPTGSLAFTDSPTSGEFLVGVALKFGRMRPHHSRVLSSRRDAGDTLWVTKKVGREPSIHVPKTLTPFVVKSYLF